MIFARAAGSNTVDRSPVTGCRNEAVRGGFLHVAADQIDDLL